MANYLITGGKPLHGTVSTGTAKNSALPAMVACLLTDEPVVLQEVPDIEDVSRMAELLSSLGVRLRWRGRTLTLRAPARLTLGRLDRAAALRLRASLLLIGALAHRGYPRLRLPYTGGCKLGRRSVLAHRYALEPLGVRITTAANAYVIERRRRALRGAELTMYESGDTPTENLLLAAVLAEGRTTVHLASANYMVQDLAYLLRAMGAQIEGIGTTTLTVDGVRRLHGATHAIMPDPIEAMLWLSLAATTRSALTILRCPIEFLRLELLKLQKMGLKVRILRTYPSASGVFTLADLTTQPSRLRALEDKIYARPFPGLNIDNLPFFVPVATQATGATLIHDWVYENRASYYLELAKLGANLHLIDQHRVLVSGPTPLEPAEVVCPPALRPATILVIGMLAAKGNSILRHTYSIDRGYANLSGRLRALGADIRETD